MSDLYFPTFQGIVLASREPFFVNATQTADNGRRLVVRKRTSVGYRYVLDVRFLLVPEEEHTALFAFFEQHGGSFDSFWFWDPVDGTARRVRFLDDDLMLKRDGNGWFYSGEVRLETVVT